MKWLLGMGACLAFGALIGWLITREDEPVRLPNVDWDGW